MTQKECLYIEDAYNHEKELSAVITDTINKLEDKSLVQFMKDQLKIHQQQDKDLKDLLEGCINE